MSQSKNTKTVKDTLVKDEAYWLNEIEYFEDAQEGIKMAYAIISAMLAKANEEYDNVKEK